MHPFFRVPELLLYSLTHLSKKDLLSCALVQRSWTELALDTAWYSVEELTELLRVLAPLNKINAGYRFARSPDILDWMRFQRTARRVRMLCCRSAHAPCGTFHPDVFKDIGLVRTSGEILPNLHTLEWGMELSCFPLFLHSGVRTLRLWLSPSHIIHTSTAIQSLCTNISLRSPNIQTLDIGSVVPPAFIEAELIQLLESLRSLERVILPPHHASPRMMNSLSRLPSLTDLSMSGLGNAPSRDGSFSSRLSHGAFNHLQTLSLSRPFPMAASVIRHLSGLLKLKKLTLLSPDCENATSIHDVLNTVAGSFPHLQGLVVWPYVGFMNFPPGLESISFAALRPLLKLSKLSTFTIHHQLSFRLSANNINEFALAFPMLETCLLNQAPYQTIMNDIPGLECLLPFAQHCPHLRQLGLHLNATASPHICLEDPTFTNLKQLHIGNSPIGDPVKPALFLAQILPKYCDLSFGVLWKNVDWQRDDSTGNCSRIHVQWRKARELIPALVQWRVDVEQRAYSRVRKELLMHMPTHHHGAVASSETTEEAGSSSSFAPQAAIVHSSSTQPIPSAHDTTQLASDTTFTTSASTSKLATPSVGPADSVLTTKQATTSDASSSSTTVVLPVTFRPGEVVHAILPEAPFKWPCTVVDRAPSYVRKPRPALLDKKICVRPIEDIERYMWLAPQEIRPLKREEIESILATSELSSSLRGAYNSALNPVEWLKRVERLSSKKKPPLDTSSLRSSSAPSIKEPQVPSTTPAPASTSTPVLSSRNASIVLDSITVRRTPVLHEKRPLPGSAVGASMIPTSNAIPSSLRSSIPLTPSSKRTITRLSSWGTQLIDVFLGTDPLTAESLTRASNIISKLEAKQNEVSLNVLQESGMIPLLRQIVTLDHNELPLFDADQHNIRERAFNLVEFWYIQFNVEEDIAGAVKVKMEE